VRQSKNLKIPEKNYYFERKWRSVRKKTCTSKEEKSIKICFFPLPFHLKSSIKISIVYNHMAHTYSFYYNFLR